MVVRVGDGGDLEHVRSAIIPSNPAEMMVLEEFPLRCFRLLPNLSVVVLSTVSQSVRNFPSPRNVPPSDDSNALARCRSLLSSRLVCRRVFASGSVASSLPARFLLS